MFTFRSNRDGVLGILFLGLVSAILLVILGSTTHCTPKDRVELAKTALESADKGCRAYLELRSEPGDAGVE